MVFDTGSPYILIFSKQCKNCKSKDSLFDQTKSSTFRQLSQYSSISFVSGSVVGYLASDRVKFEELVVIGNNVVLANQNSLQLAYQGVCGLSKDPNYKNLFEIGYESGKLVSSIFGFKLGNLDLNQKSLFYYNISQSDIQNMTWIEASSGDYWKFNAQVYVNDQNQETFDLIFDTGTTTFVFPSLYLGRIIDKYFSPFCQYQDVKYSSMYYECPCDYQKLPVFKFYVQGVELLLTPQIYLRKTNDYFPKCIFSIYSSEMKEIVLGDLFLRQHTVFFDKLRNRIGLEKKSYMTYLSDKNNILMRIIEVLLVLLVLLVFWLSYKKDNSNNMTHIEMGETVQHQAQTNG